MEKERSLLEGRKLTFIGGGNMAEAMVKGLLQASLVTPEAVIVADVDQPKLRLLHDTYGVRVIQDNAGAALEADIIVLAVKPQVIPSVLADLRPVVDHTRLIISVAAGVPLSAIASRLDSCCRVVRVMPNTPALVQAGAAAIALGEKSTPEDRQLAREIFQTLGVVVEVDEVLMDAVTGLSGSGPAYIFVIVEAMTDGGVKMGLPRDIAQRLAIQTVLGSAKMLLELKEHPAQLKDRVTSPGGTTIAGLHQLEAGRLRATLINAVEAATLRSQELGRKVNEP